MTSKQTKGLAKALFVIDIQEDYTGSTAKPPFPYKESEKLILAVNQVIEAASKQGIPVVYIRQEFDGLGRFISKLLCGGTAIKGKPGTELDKRVKIVSDHLFPKPAPDAFSNVKLEAFLKERQIKELYLVGLDAEFCVHETAKGALKKGFKVSIITDCIALRAEKKWDDLLSQYQQEGITLITSNGF